MFKFYKLKRYETEITLPEEVTGYGRELNIPLQYFVCNKTVYAYPNVERKSLGLKIEIYSVPTTVNPNQLKSATISNTTLSAFPNPAKTFVNLSYNVSGVEDAEMVITDASGRVVERRIVNAMQDNLRLNVANYKRGIYFYEVQGFTGRFIVE